MLSDADRLPAAPAWFAHLRGGERRLGVVDPAGDAVRWIDCGPRDELALLRSGRLDAAGVAALATGGTALRAEPAFDVPIARPRKILCLGKNFAAHAAEFGAAVPEEPMFFAKLPDSMLAHRGTILLPYWLATRVDHEIELAVVLGFVDPECRGRKHVPRERAHELVAGYTLLNDVTARQLQGADRGERKPWLRSKSFDTFCPVGPWVVPAGGIRGAGDLRIRLWVNGELRQDSRTSHMVVAVEDAIAYLSRHTTLHCGDLIAMGTPEGVGLLRPGDRIEGAIEQLGALVNDVAREADPPGSDRPA